MKRTFRILAAALLLTAVLCVSASAADFEPVAQELSAIGMFRGTGAGFELDRAPTRAEAAIMLVRLYGAEEEASQDYADGTISHPFTDVPDYAAPHAAWLYSEGLTKGISADTFGSALPCSDQNYATFLLRALGYADGTDFDYANALTFAQEKGFYTPLMFSGEFLRDDLAAMTYQALAADTADGKTYLLDRLIRDGAIDKEAALPMVSKMELYRDLAALESAEGGEEALDMDLLISADMTMTAGAETMTSSLYMSGSAQVVMEEQEMEMAYAMTTVADGAMMDMGMWMKDGWVYQYASDGATVQRIKYAVEDEMALYEDLGVAEMTAVDVSGLAALKSLTREKDGSDTLYTMVITEGMGGMMDGIMDLALQNAGTDAPMALNIGELTIGYRVSRKDELKELAIEMPYTMTMAVPDESGTPVPVQAEMNMKMLMTINAMGKNVKIDYPDLSAFVEVDPYTMQPVV